MEYLDKHHKKSNSKNYFSNRKSTDKNNDNHLNEDKYEVLDKVLLVDIMGHEEVNECLNEFIYKEKINKLNPIVNVTSINTNDFGRTRYVSTDSNNVFFQKYHKFEEMKRKGNLNENTPSMAFINSCKRDVIVPNPVGIIKRSGNDTDLNLNHFRVGDEYVKALSKSLKFSDHLNEIRLGGNRLTSNSINPLLISIKENSRLFKRIEVLDLSYNLISEDCVKRLCDFINDSSCELKEINLEGNNLGDKNVVQISDCIINYLADKLIILNFGKNMISDKGALAMSQIAQNCINLKVLILYWNNIINYFASLIIRSLKKHTELRVLDLSWNSIGNNLLQGGMHNDKPRETKKLEKIEKKDSKDAKKEGKNENQKEEVKVTNKDIFDFILHSFKKPGLIPISNNPKGISEFAKELGEYFKEEGVDLIHLDISHNNINQIDSAYISEEVKSNHTILGIHVDGNEMTIDELGFIVPLTKDLRDDKSCANSQIYYKIDRENFIKTKINNIRKIRAKNNCWICEGWKEIEFIYKISEEIRKNIKGPPVVKIHFGFENWKPYEMTFRYDQWICYRMCPPGEVFYFYSINSEIDHFTTKNEKCLNLKDVKDGSFEYKLKVINEDDEEEIITKNISKLCKKYTELWTNIIDSSYKKYLEYCEPRPQKKIDINFKPRTPWIFQISIWYSYEYNYDGDSKEYLDKVFENDFSKISKNRDGEIDETIMECKKILRDNFKNIIDTYRFLSSQLGSAIWQISPNTLNEFCNNCTDLLDSEYNINSVFLQEKAAKAADKSKKYKNMPDNLIRHQFLSLIIRVAKDKYLRTKVLNTVLEAVTVSLEKHFIQAMQDYDSNQWRIERYYNENVDNFLKAFLPYFEVIYKSWAPKKDPGSRDTWMELKEFNELVLSFVDHDFPQREIPLIFNNSIKLQINEIENDRQYKMQFYEFIEGFCRVVDKASPAPPNSNPEDWPTSRRHEQQLSVKLENLINTLQNLIKNPEFRHIKEKFPQPSKEESTGLFKYDSNNIFYQNLQVPKTIFNKPVLNKKSSHM